MRGVVIAVLAVHAAAAPCDTTPAPGPAPAPAPAPVPGCSDQPSDWKSTEGSTCADYAAKQWCTADGGYGSGWKDEWGKFDKWAANGVSANVACCVCGGGSTASGPCDTTPAPGPAPAPAPAPAPGCSDKPSGWKGPEGSTCADYGTKQWCTTDGGYGSGWKDEWGKFDKWTVNGVSADVACCVCGGGSTVSGKQACQGHSYDKNACAAVGCCYWNVLLGCRANDADEMCYSDKPCDTTDAPGPGHHHGAVIGGAIAGATALAVAGAIAARGTTTIGPSTTASGQTTQGAQTTAPTAVTTTTENSSSSLLWLWILLGILALCCLLALCGGGLAACMGGKKKKKKKSRATRVSQPAPVPVVQPIVEEQQELLPIVPPLLEPMGAPTMVETVQMVPMATPTMVESAVPMMTTATPTAVSAMPAMTTMQMPASAGMSMMPVMQGVGGYGTQAFPAMAGSGFGTQAMQGISGGGFGTQPLPQMF